MVVMMKVWKLSRRGSCDMITVGGNHRLVNYLVPKIYACLRLAAGNDRQNGSGRAGKAGFLNDLWFKNLSFLTRIEGLPEKAHRLNL